MDRERLSQLDLCFVVDCTSSMFPFIHIAQSQAEAILTMLAAQFGADMRFAVVGYRDHGHDPVCDVVPFAAAEKDAIHAALSMLGAGANNNPDAAEAVFAGLVAAGDLVWRESALRVLVLIGDAPPHGCGASMGMFPDRFPQDPTGYDLAGMSAHLERLGIAAFALAMVPSRIPEYDGVTAESFGALARATGGIQRIAMEPQGAMEVLTEIAKRAFGDLDLDRRVFIELESAGALTPGAAPPSPAPAMASAMGIAQEELALSLHRLQRRKIVERD